MPYITQPEKEWIDIPLNALMNYINTPGQFCYVVYRMIGMYINRVGLSFHNWSMIRGATEEAIVEYRRRYIEVYEDQKHSENGDVTF